jgi:hypothetical protein
MKSGILPTRRESVIRESVGVGIGKREIPEGARTNWETDSHSRNHWNILSHNGLDYGLRSGAAVRLELRWRVP